MQWGMKMEENPISVEEIVLTDDLRYHGEILLTYSIEYPEFHSARFRPCMGRMNRFYKSRALAFRAKCETELFRRAVEQYKGDIKHGFPVRVFEAMQVYEVTYLRGCIVSLYVDRYEFTGGAHGATVRASQSWNAGSCGFLRLKRLVRCPPDSKSYVLEQAASQIQKEPESYFANYPELLAQNFDKNSFYCTPEAVVVYYQQYDVAPYSTGIPEFPLPYGGCVTDPLALCGENPK